MKPVITYFAVRGRVEPIRLMFEELGVAYENRNVSLDEWPSLKPTLPFKVLPVVDMDGLGIVESRAIVCYVARKRQLYGHDAREVVQCDILAEARRDYHTALVMLFWDKTFRDKAESFRQNQLVANLSNLENYLGGYARHADCCVGNALTLADFILWNHLDCVRAFPPSTLGDFRPCPISSARSRAGRGSRRTWHPIAGRRPSRCRWLILAGRRRPAERGRDAVGACRSVGDHASTPWG